LSHGKNPEQGAAASKGYRNREGETLFIDAHKIGFMISRMQKKLDSDDISAQRHSKIAA
jgi:type I restriction enzyme M protein